MIKYFCKFLVLLLFFLNSTAILAQQFEAEQAADQPISVPIYSFPELEHIFQQDNDTTYVINFWATWCKPCVEELPYFEQLTETYANDKVKVILVSLDFKKQVESKLIPFVKKHKLQSQVMVLYDPDTNSWIDKVSPEWSGAIPATIVYKGKNRQFYEKQFDSFEQINSIIQSFINS